MVHRHHRGLQWCELSALRVCCVSRIRLSECSVERFRSRALVSGPGEREARPVLGRSKRLRAPLTFVDTSLLGVVSQRVACLSALGSWLKAPW